MALSRITAKSIQDGTVVAADIADGSITTAKIADANVTAGKIVSVANTQITGNITSSQIVPNPTFNGNTTVTNIITGAGTVGAPSIAPTGDTNTGIFFPAADNIGFATNGVIRGRWTTDGLCFGSDTAAANALDDYEEGTWTATVKLGATTNTVGTGAAFYVKIGSVVYIGVTATGITKSGSGSLTIAGLPFSALGGAGRPDSSFVCRWDDITSAGVIIPYASGTAFDIQNFSNTGYVGSINDTNCSATYAIYGIYGFYYTV